MATSPRWLRQHSTCPSGKRGGDLGSFGSGAMVKEFDAVAFDDDYALDTVHGPIKTEFGYHLIVVKKRTGLVVWTSSSALA